MIRNIFRKKGDKQLNDSTENNEAEIVDLADEMDENQAQESAGDANQADSVNEKQTISLEADLKNKLLRLQADFDNYRKRTIAGRNEARDEARREVLLDLLPIYDNFQRALDHAEEVEDYGSLRAGIHGIMQQMQDFFQRQNLREIDSAPGTLFDPNKHDALGTMPGNDDNHNTVGQEILKGFELNGNVIRPAQVLVFTGP